MLDRHEFIETREIEGKKYDFYRYDDQGKSDISVYIHNTEPMGPGFVVSGCSIKNAIYNLRWVKH